MFRPRNFWTITCLVVLNLLVVCPPSFAQGSFSISLGPWVVADPGQVGVPMRFTLISSDSVAGFDLLVEFDPTVLTCSSVDFLTRFQYVSYDNSLPGKLRIVTRRHHSDSSYLSPLSPGTDTLGVIWLEVTSQDLLADVEAPLDFFEDPATPFADNILVKRDSSFVTLPELALTGGSVYIRRPLYGDVNDDGYAYTIADAIFFFNYLAGSQNLSSRQRANSDVNKDGIQASMTDFIRLLTVITEE